MEYFNLDRDIARLMVLQRIELAGPKIKKIRKIFGRYLFTNFFSKFFISPKQIGKEYFKVMSNELKILEKYMDFENKKILSIGAGMCGLELIINEKFKDNFFSIIEKDYISKKVSYGWDEDNNEAYNRIDLLKNFLNINKMSSDSYEIYNFDKDKDNLPIKKFDYIISLFSLDYHYNFSLYFKYLKKVMDTETRIVFDTIRPDYFQNIFENVEIISNDTKLIHSSKRIVCNKLII
tara:strand:+ start:152 stop:856 length:705 start_codon:yes stop_codon:yes gene_type:complete